MAMSSRQRMTKRRRELAKLAKEYGCELKLRPGGHFAFMKGTRIVEIAGGTPSDYHSDRNVVAKLKRDARRCEA